MQNISNCLCNNTQSLWQNKKILTEITKLLVKFKNI